MEVMSSLLLCALVGLLPQTLVMTTNSVLFYNPHDTIAIKENTPNEDKPDVMLKMISLSPANKSDDQEVPKDFNCVSCEACIQRAIQKYLLDIAANLNSQNALSPDFKLSELITIVEGQIQRQKRESDNESVLAASMSKRRRERKMKARKNKVHKSVSVSRYISDNAVYALKVKETNVTGFNSEPVSSCHVFRVVMSHPCDTPMGQMILDASQTNLTKQVESTVVAEDITPEPESEEVDAYTDRKRIIDSTLIPENEGMTSVEEFY